MCGGRPVATEAALECNPFLSISSPQANAGNKRYILFSLKDAGNIHFESTRMVQKEGGHY